MTKRHDIAIQHSSKRSDWRTPRGKTHWFWRGATVQSNGCWFYRGTTKTYGTVNFEGKLQGAHRVAFYLAYGWWPTMVCHECDHPPCMRPTHLFAGDARLNLLDARKKGRAKTPYNPRSALNLGRYPGEQNGNSKLTHVAVRRIRRLRDWSISALSREFGVARSTVRAVLNQETWR